MTPYSNPVRAVALMSLLCIAAACGGGDSKTPSGPDPTAVTSVVIEPANATLTALGATQQFTASARNSTGGTVSGKTFAYTSSASSVATVSSSGLVTSVANGSASITATLTGGTLSASASVAVTQAVAAMTLTPATGTVAVGATQQLSVAATDSRGAAVASPSVSYTSSATTVASVSGSGLVTGLAPGSATITATSGSVVRTAVITVVFPDLILVRDTALSGTRSYRTITVPTSVTLTASAALTLRSTGQTIITGTVTGSCVAIDIGSDTALTITGTVRNGCAANTGGDLRLAANGELTITDATITSSGDITLTNDPTLTDANFPPIFSQTAAPGNVRFSFAQQPGVPFTRVARSTVMYQAGSTGPNPADNGTNGVNGGNGSNGRTVKMWLRGNAIFDGGTLLWGQDGGNGGTGSNTSNANVTVTGGAGGSGGLIKVYITGSLTYQGTPTNTVRSGKGGAGGSASATSTTNAALAAAPSATATGGTGGEPGLIDIRAGGGIVITGSALTLDVPLGGVGGAATALAANGVDALVASANSPAQPGGAATATGGKGGNTPNARLSASGVAGAAVLMVPGAGAGGLATATAGTGGNGIKPQKNGAIGGAISATGGAGGNSQLRNLANSTVGTGGNGGNGVWRMGNGGAGWNDCATGMLELGGSGGQGGTAAGARGIAGTGMVGGNDGTTRFETVGNGGKAGDGAGPGARGAAGTNSVAGTIGATVNPIFTIGAAGLDCTAQPPAPTTFTVDLSAIVHNNGIVANGTQILPLENNNTVFGSVPFEFISPTFKGTVPQHRTGIGAGGRILVKTGIMEINSQNRKPNSTRICVLNASGAVTIRELSMAQSELSTRTVQPPSGCAQFDNNSATDVVEVSVSSGSADMDIWEFIALATGAETAPQDRKR